MMGARAIGVIEQGLGACPHNFQDMPNLSGQRENGLYPVVYWAYGVYAERVLESPDCTLP